MNAPHEVEHRLALERAFDNAAQTAQFFISLGEVLPAIDRISGSISELHSLVEQNKLPPVLTVSWPGRLSRALAVTQLRLQCSIELVCDRHTEIGKAIAISDKLQSLVEDYVCGKPYAKLLRSNAMHWKQELAYWDKQLHDFDVSVQKVEPGDEFDAEVHKVVDDIIVDDPKLVGTIAEAFTACYRWRDENGIDQVREAEVILRKEA